MRHKIKILHLTPHYAPFSISGGAFFAKEISEGLQSRGHKVTVVAPNEKEHRKTEILYKNGVKILLTPTLDLKLKLVRKYIDNVHRVSDYMNTNNNVFSSFWAKGLILPPYNQLYVFLHILLNSSNYDIINAISVVASPLYVSLLTRSLKVCKCRILTIPFLHIEQPEFKRSFILCALRKVDAILTETPYEKLYLRKIGIKSDKIFVIGNGIKIEKYRLTSKVKTKIKEIKHKYNINDNTRIILWLGRRYYNKGYYHTIQAMKIIWRHIQNCKLIMVGEHIKHDCVPLHLKRETEKLIHMNKDKIIDLGIVNEEEKIALLHLCDLLILPSKSETIPIVFSEAWACKKPIICARIRPLWSIINYEGDGAFTVSFGNIMEIAEKAITLLLNDELREKIGLLGYNKVKSFLNMDSVLKRVENAYIEVLSS